MKYGLASEKFNIQHCTLRYEKFDVLVRQTYSSYDAGTEREDTRFSKSHTFKDRKPPHLYLQVRDHISVLLVAGGYPESPRLPSLTVMLTHAAVCNCW